MSEDLEGFVDALCPGCNGSGEGYAEGTKCRACNGSGEYKVLTCDNCDIELFYLKKNKCDLCGGRL